MPGMPSIERHEFSDTSINVFWLMRAVRGRFYCFRLATGVPQQANGTNDAREAADA